MGVNLPGLGGVHHVSAICGDPQRNHDFYTGLLGLRLVKKTVNFDDPGTYHLYYGDAVGTPGTLLTFFAWTHLPPMVSAQGRVGTGQAVAVQLAIPAGSMQFWLDRIALAAADFEVEKTPTGETYLLLRDPDGMQVELLEGGVHNVRAWTRHVPAEHAIAGVAGIRMYVESADATAVTLTDVLGMQQLSADDNGHTRFATAAKAATIDLHCRPDAAGARMGIGSIHHVAWRVPAASSLEAWRSALSAQGLNVTTVLDRRYFHSIYFREPGGVLFELATDGPGFTVDEREDALGSEVQLPPWLESRRTRIIARLPELRT